MKKRILKIMSAFVLVFSFFLTGCIPSADASAFEAPSDEIQGASDNANDMMKTANNATYYYDNLIDLNNDKGLEAIDRNMVDDCFSAVYLFVDPGSEHEYIDHFSGSSQPFYRLVDREIDILAQALYQLIDKIYIGGQQTPSPVIAGNINGESGAFNYNTDNITIPTEKLIKINDLQIIDATSITEDQDGTTVVTTKGENELNAEILDLGNIATYKYIANAYNASLQSDLDSLIKVNPFYIESLEGVSGTVGDSTATINVPINNYMINLKGAIYGGYKLETFDTAIVEGITYSVPVYTNFSTTTYNGGDYEWNVSAPDKLKNELKYRIAAAVSGKQVSGSYDATKYLDVVKTIDHTGFTEQDQKNIVNQILNNIIGEDVIAIDDALATEINREFNVIDGLCVNIANPYEENWDKILNLFIDEGQAFQNYKAYRIIIKELVDQATKISCTHQLALGVFEGGQQETLVPGFPRLQVMVVNPRDFMDAVGYEEENGEINDSEDIEADDIPTDTEGTEFTKKLLESINLKAVLFLPKKLYGERTMAKKDGDTWVEDEDGNQEFDVFKVEGFLVTNFDVVLLADEGNNAVVQGNYTAKITNKDASGNEKVVVKHKQGEAFEVGNELPDPTVEESYNSTNFLDIEGTELLVKKEEDPMSENDPTTIHEMRMQGYDGLMLTELGIVMDMGASTDGVGVPVSTATFTTQGNYNLFTFSTDMYKYLTVDSVVGEGAGYSLNIDQFAGGNYVLADFSVLQVNDDESNRECKFNILYMACETS